MKTILIIDNMSSIRCLVKTILADKNHNVLEATDRTSMFRVLKENKNIDLILMDLGLSGITGEELIKELKNNPETKSIKIAAFTGDNSFSTLKKLSKYDIVDYIIKPIKINDFCGRIEGLLNKEEINKEDFLDIDIDIL